MSLLSTALALHAAVPSSDHTLLAATEVSTGGLRQWIADNVFFLILIMIGVVVAVSGGLKGNVSSVATKVGLTLAALGVFVLAGAPDAATSVGQWVVGLFGVDI